MSNSIKILLVDDDPFVQRCVCRMLGACKVLTASSVAEAKNLFLETEEFSAVISDLQLWDGDGLAFHDWIRKRSLVPFLLIPGSRCSVPERSGFGILAKPFRPGELWDKLQVLIGEATLLAEYEGCSSGLAV